METVNDIFERYARSFTARQLVAELSRRGAIVSIRDWGSYSLADMAVSFTSPDGKSPTVPTLSFNPSADCPARGSDQPRAFDADQYFLELVSSGVPLSDAQRLANTAADVDALLGELAAHKRGATSPVIDPAFKRAWRESQGQPIDAEPR